MIDELIEVLQAAKRCNKIKANIATAYYILSKADGEHSVSKELDANKRCLEILKQVLIDLDMGKYLFSLDD